MCVCVCVCVCVLTSHPTCSTIVLAMASYSEGYVMYKNKIAQSVKTALSAITFALNPRDKAQRLMQQMRTGNVRFGESSQP